MGTLREDITEIKVGVATIAEHIKSVDNRLEDGDKRFNNHSKAIHIHDTDLIEIRDKVEKNSEGVKRHGKALWWIVTQSVLVLLAMVGFLAKIIWEYVKTKGLPTP